MSDAKDYITKKQIPQLFECLMTGLMYHRPGDHVAYLQGCLNKIKVQGVSGVRWDLFLETKRTNTPLPPLTPPKSGKSSCTSPRAELSEKKQPLPPIGAEVAKAAKVVSWPVVLVVGGPGSGKRQLCRQLARRYGFGSLCVGDLVRQKIREERDSKRLWSLAGAAVESGDAVPEELLLPTLAEALASVKADCRGLFVEGYPRTLAQAEAMVEHIPAVDCVVLLDFEEDLLQERLLRRYQKVGSIEDQPANIAKRIGFFRTQTLPVCREYDEAKQLLVLPVDEELSGSALVRLAAKMLDAKYDVKEESVEEEEDAPQAETEATPSTVTATGVTFVREIADLPAASARPQELAGTPLVLVIGGPGSGRSSQLQRLAERYDGFAHVNVSEEARRRSLGSGGAWDALIDIATTGDIDDEAVDASLVRELLTSAKGAKCFLVEGFPINERQLRGLYAEVGQPDLTVLLDCEEPYMVRRLLQRGKETGAVGDNLAAVSKRIAYFKEHTLPVVRHFDDQGKLCIILGDRDSSEVFYDFASLIDYVFFKQVPDHVKQQQDRAAETIQAAFHGFLAREEFAGKMDASDSNDQSQQQQQQQQQQQHTEEEEAAAAKIQAGFRGHQTRRRLADK